MLQVRVLPGEPTSQSDTGRGRILGLRLRAILCPVRQNRLR
jgi:hypothetical protein